MVSKGALPKDLWSCNAAMTCISDWLDNDVLAYVLNERYRETILALGQNCSLIRAPW